MKYLVLVSHGQFADGLADSLSMLAGQRDDIISVGLQNGSGVDEFAKELTCATQQITQDDEIILLGDLIGGSPLTTAMNVFAEQEIQYSVIGGMNLPLALTTVLMKDALNNEDLITQVLEEAHLSLKQFKIENEDEEDI